MTVKLPTPIVAGPALPKPLPSPQPSLPQPRPVPLPQLKPGVIDRFLTPARSQSVANTQASQLDSIRKGVLNGSITEKEASKLLGQQARISEATSRAASDGVVTAKEAAAIRLQQARAGIDTFLARINGQHAKPSDPAIAKQQATQIHSIAQGVRSGSLTGSEAGTLLRDQADIASEVHSAQADGEMDFIEQQLVSIRQAAAGFEIGLEKRDAEKAPHAKRLNFPVHF